MNIEQLHIGMTVVEVSPYGRETIPMHVVGIFQDGTVYLDFEGNEGYSTKDLPDTENRGFGISTSKSMLVDGLKGAFFMLSGGAFHRHDSNVNVFIKLPETINWNGTIILMRIPVTVPANFNYLKYIR